ncbi:MAG: hypothetical protein MJZ07_04005 [Bacteroidales bacterium]|nr:hypothetical protein [Bacteroidales bacterium]
MKRTDDILKDSRLKEQAFTVPEGYFENLASKLETVKAASGKTSPAGRLVPYLAIAASFALIASVGTAILKKTVHQPEEEISLESYYSQLVNDDFSEDEVVSYLLCYGISAEEITELSK